MKTRRRASAGVMQCTIGLIVYLLFTVLLSSSLHHRFPKVHLYNIPILRSARISAELQPRYFPLNLSW